LTTPMVSFNLPLVDTYQPHQQLNALGDATRRAIFERLAHGPLPVAEIARGLPVSRPAVSQHLKVLKSARLVSDRAEGTRRVYQHDAQGLAALKGYFEKFWSEALDAFRIEAERSWAEKPRTRTNPAQKRQPQPGTTRERKHKS
jgi:DNA-binding transcriptional ArsR family regulator